MTELDFAALLPPPTSFLCPITQELMTDPVAAADGSVYERAAIQAWFRTRHCGNRSPVTNMPLPTTTLSEVVPLRRAIEEYVNWRPGLVHREMDRATLEVVVRHAGRELEMKAATQKVQKAHLDEMQSHFGQQVARLQKELMEMQQIVEELVETMSETTEPPRDSVQLCMEDHDVASTADTESPMRVGSDVGVEASEPDKESPEPAEVQSESTTSSPGGAQAHQEEVPQDGSKPENASHEQRDEGVVPFRSKWADYLWMLSPVEWIIKITAFLCYLCIVRVCRWVVPPMKAVLWWVLCALGRSLQRLDILGVGPVFYELFDVVGGWCWGGTGPASQAGHPRLRGIKSWLWRQLRPFLSFAYWNLSMTIYLLWCYFRFTLKMHQFRLMLGTSYFEKWDPFVFCFEPYGIEVTEMPTATCWWTLRQLERPLGEWLSLLDSGLKRTLREEGGGLQVAALATSERSG